MARLGLRFRSLGPAACHSRSGRPQRVIPRRSRGTCFSLAPPQLSTAEKPAFRSHHHNCLPPPPPPTASHPEERSDEGPMHFACTTAPLKAEKPAFRSHHHNCLPPPPPPTASHPEERSDEGPMHFACTAATAQVHRHRLQRDILSNRLCGCPILRAAKGGSVDPTASSPPKEHICSGIPIAES